MKENKATLVTSLYNHGPHEIMGGRGWAFPFYAPPFLNILKLDLPLVIYTDSKMFEPLTAFMKEYCSSPYKIIEEPLTDFKFSNKILELKEATGHFENGNLIKGTDILNDRNHHLCLSKIYWLKRYASKNYEELFDINFNRLSSLIFLSVSINALFFPFIWIT